MRLDSQPELLLATTNVGKQREFARLVPADVVIRTLADVSITLPPETGVTFSANADLKAIAASLESGLLALADDSGLEVAALGGAPGVRSARFAGEPVSDERNRDAVLAALAGVPPERRQARFVCAVTLSRQGSVIARAEGVCNGAIARSPRGGHGFGYDPIFLLPDGRTMAELPPAEKNEISHRATAYRRLLPELLAALGFDMSTGVSR